MTAALRSALAMVAAPLSALLFAIPVCGQQTANGGITVQAGFHAGSSEFAALGISVTGEAGLGGPVGVYARFVEPQAFFGCAGAEDGPPTECRVDPMFLDLGLRIAPWRDQDVVPWARVGVGSYRRSDADPSAAFLLTQSMGLDAAVRKPVWLRLSLDFYEVPSDELRSLRDGTVWFFGMQVGLRIDAG